jgi:hypothetical protein
MGKESYTINFEGYWREGTERDMPMSSGIFCVLDARMIFATGALKPEKLIYIGTTGNARKSLENHPNKPSWKKHLKPGNHIAYSFARVSADQMNRVMAALVYHHKPPENTQYKNVFPFDRTNVLTAGKVATLGGLITAKRTK